MSNFTIKQSENKEWWLVLHNDELYCKTKSENIANQILSLAMIYENAVNEVQEKLKGVGDPVGDKILKEFIRPMVTSMTKEIRKNTSPEVRLEVRRKMREVERQIDQVREPVEEQTKADIEKLNKTHKHRSRR
ncbi:MAG: hypothetical protein ACYC6W_08860 [Nitrosotalea sp.]